MYILEKCWRYDVLCRRKTCFDPKFLKLVFILSYYILHITIYTQGGQARRRISQDISTINDNSLRIMPGTGGGHPDKEGWGQGGRVHALLGTALYRNGWPRSKPRIEADLGPKGPGSDPRQANGEMTQIFLSSHFSTKKLKISPSIRHQAPQTQE